MAASDILLLDIFSPTTKVQSLRDRFSLKSLPIPATCYGDRSQEIGMAELIVFIDSKLIGKTAAGSRFRTHTSLTVIDLGRGTTAQDGLTLVGRDKNRHRKRHDASLPSPVNSLDPAHHQLNLRRLLSAGQLRLANLVQKPEQHQRVLARHL